MLTDLICCKTYLEIVNINFVQERQVSLKINPQSIFFIEQKGCRVLLAGFQILTVDALLVSKYILAAWLSLLAPETEFF